MSVSDWNPAWRSGSDNYRAVMSDLDVLHARIIRATINTSVQELAKLYDISRSSMSLLLRGITYQEAGGPLDPGRKSPSKRTRRR